MVVVRERKGVAVIFKGVALGGMFVAMEQLVAVAALWIYTYGKVV